MNPHLEELQPYPFQRLGTLLEGVQAPAGLREIPFSLGEPRHPAPQFIVEALTHAPAMIRSLGTYPSSQGVLELRQAIAGWLERRYGFSPGSVDPNTQVLPVSGTREALFAFAQATISPQAGPDQPLVLMPNPFYQIYEGAALLAGARPYFLPCLPENRYQPDFAAVPAEVWRRCQLLYLCSPGNPTGAVLDLPTLSRLIELADEHDFLIASDECYSEIYFDEAAPPTGLLQACRVAGNTAFRRCVVFNSLSKRSSLPGLRSGFVAGDAEALGKFLLYRTYHGAALPLHTQLVSTLAWQDEAHVVANRALYRQKMDSIHPLIGQVLPVDRPDAGFYLWPEVPDSDETFTRELFAATNVKVLPGTYLGRTVGNLNPGHGRVRMALVASQEDCLTAAGRIVDFVRRR